MSKANKRQPMTLAERVTAYQSFNDRPGHQTGLSSKGARHLTPRQWRRVQHKRNRAAARAGVR